MDISLRMLADASNAQGAFKDFGSVVTVAGGIVKQFAADSIKAYADAERVQKQLQAAAGEYTKALSDQAEVLKQKYAVDDDQIRQLEVLALRYGAAPGQIQKATEAVLNFSAATGKDATSAMEQLVRGVESGTGSLGRMGVHFKTTGDFVKDMDSAVGALGSKFAGAAEADANSLEGRMRRVTLAIDDLHKSFGALFAAVEDKLHIFDGLTKAMDRITAGVQEGGWGGLFHAVGLKQKWEEEAEAREGGQTATGIHLRLPGASAGGLPMTSDGDHQVGGGGGGGGAKAAKQQAEYEAYLNAENEYLDKKWLLEQQDAEQGQKHQKERELIAQHEVDVEAEKAIKLNEEIERSNQLMEEGFLKNEADHQKDLQKLGAMQFDFMKDQTDQMGEELERRTELFTHAGMQIGQALINGIFAVIAAAASKDGSDQSKGQIAAAQGLMNAIFSAFGMGWLSSGAFSAINANEQGGAGAGLGAFASGTAGNIRFDQSAGSYHQGGWIPRFHEGGGFLAQDERMAILQTGERVLSRGEVGAMGGQAGVESAVQGGGGRPLVIQAFDSSSILDFFGDRGGKGMMAAARANVGPLRLMFGKVG